MNSSKNRQIYRSPSRYTSRTYLELSPCCFHRASLISFSNYSEVLAVGWENHIKQYEVRGWLEVHVIARRPTVAKYIGYSELAWMSIKYILKMLS